MDKMAERAQKYEAQFLGEIDGREPWETAMQIREWHEVEEDEGLADGQEQIPTDILEWAQGFEE